jgi:F-type H+-transporting ATPase subunit delta
MSTGRIANRYAKPLLALAEDQKVLDQVKADMDGFAALCRENREFLLMLRSPIIPHLKKAEILKSIFDGKANKLTLAVFDIITRKNRENLLAEISEEFIRLYNEKMGYQEATITTTFPIDSSLRSSFEKIITQVTGSKAVMNEEIDTSILGGYILKMGDKQLDQSVSAHLKEIKLKFTKK